MSLSIVKCDSIWLKYVEGWNTQKALWLYKDLYYVNMQSTFLKWWFKKVILVSDWKSVLCPEQIQGTCKEVSLTLAFLSVLSWFFSSVHFVREGRTHLSHFSWSLQIPSIPFCRAGVWGGPEQFSIHLPFLSKLLSTFFQFFSLMIVNLVPCMFLCLISGFLIGT